MATDTISLSAEEVASYSAKIDKILASSDLNTISAKRIRKNLQERLSHDISRQKDAINDLIAQRFDAVATDKGVIEPSSPPQPAATVNGTSHHGKSGAEAASSAGSPSAKHSDVSDGVSDVADDGPPKKKAKRSVPVDADAAYAARLQAEENSRARPTRGGGVTKKRQATKQAKAPKKKSSTKVKPGEDSDLDSGSGNEKAKKKTGAFHKPQHLSPPLAQLLGESILSRPQTVKGLWDYVKGKGLQNPNDKRQIRCDDALRAVFKKDQVNMFTMNKFLSSQLTPVDEAV